MTTADRLRLLASRVRAERELPEGERPTAAGDGSLDTVAGALDRAADRVRAGDHDGGRAGLAEATRSVVDSWSTTSELALDVLRTAQALRRTG